LSSFRTCRVISIDVAKNQVVPVNPLDPENTNSIRFTVVLCIIVFMLPVVQARDHQSTASAPNDITVHPMKTLVISWLKLLPYCTR